ncbi:MAG TPA: FAD-binding oxidoreductase [Anaerolineaceae bacterium]|jgi:sarcosine oxidase subunit beta
MPTYDVIVIGGGFHGLATAYQLSKAGVRTLLLEARDIGSGTSAACGGRAQVCEGHLDDLNTRLIRDGLKRHATLQEELDSDYEWRWVALLLLLKDESMRKLWIERSSALTTAGIPTEIIDPQSLQEAEPHLLTDGLIGAVHSVEGTLNPLKFAHAYARAAARSGATIQGHSAVIGLEMQGRRVTGVRTASETYHAGSVAVMTGSWINEITRMAGVEFPIRNTHAEAFITERIPVMIHNNIGVADSYETIYGEAQAVALGIVPEPDGSLYLAEAVAQTEELHARSTRWGIAAIARAVDQYYPFLRKVRVVRSWARPTSIFADEEPMVGWAPQLENVFISTSLLETITVMPVLSEWMALLIQGQTPPVNLARYSPTRFVTA